MTCVWTPNGDCFSAIWAEVTLEDRTFALELASATLHRLTGYRVGGCPITVRPSRGTCCFVPTLGHRPAVSPGVDANGQWRNDCGCSEFRDTSVTLHGPVGGIIEVMVDGQVIDPTMYRVRGRSLVWQGPGVAPWPVTQDVDRPDTEVGTFSVTYLNSYEPDSSGRCAVAKLAEEFGKALSGKGKCRLPSNVTSITRQGISMELMTGQFADGVTGLREVDAWLALWNPGNLRQQSKVWFPGMKAPVHR